jgi:hypothetical protein
MPEIIILHRIGDNKPVYITKSTLVEWYEDTSGTHLTKLDGGARVVKETPEEIVKLYEAS